MEQVFYSLFFKDSNERTFEAQEVLQMLMQKTEVPIYGVWDFNLGSGIVGGLLTSGLYQGRAAAEKAVSYLEKGKLDEADIIFNSPNRYMFDYAQLKRLDIPLPQLPDDSILINKPITFYELYQKEAWLVGLAFLFSTLLLILQRKHIIKHKENEVTLQQQRYKLRDQNKTLEDKVNERTWELNNAKEAAEQSMRNEQHSSAELARYVDIVDRHVISSQTDLKGVITEVSSAFCKISGYSKEELMGKNHNIVRNPNTEKTLYQEIWGTISQGKVWEGELNNKTKDGSYYWVETTIEPIKNETGYIYGYISISSNITDKKRVEELSITDTLTGLSNRLRLDELLLTEFKRMQRYSIELSIILCDIDFFKKVNDNYGHLVGDETLKTLAKIFINHCREVDFIGRWGGEEFLIICPETSAEQAVLVAEKLKSQIGNHNFPVVGKITCSFGVSSITPNDLIKDTLLRADNALYTAKEKGRNRVEML